MQTITKELSIEGKPIRIHGISTGKVSVKTRFRDSKLQGIPGIFSSLTDRKFTEWMPIWVWVIEHPEGIFVIDTGENANVNDKDYFKSAGPFLNWLNNTQFKFEVSREEEIDRQLERLGINSSEIKLLILTHLHLDHTDGLRHFPEIDVIVNKKEREKGVGEMHHLYPDWFNPVFVELNEVYAPFESALSLTHDGNMVMLETPGHSFGHSSVLLVTDQASILFAGDVCYYEEQIRSNIFAGATPYPKLGTSSYNKIRELGRREKLVVLPSHDNDSGQRLTELKPLY
ncbi:MAG: N-acyl homoserine lactonase family protein [Bacteroidia bacterium]|nr:N-acyl homoserine lactonase family protein [Bacteroidia bacterium]